MGYSIIQWGSGNVGSHAIAAIAQRRDLQLKGLFVLRAQPIDATQALNRSAGVS